MAARILNDIAARFAGFIPWLERRSRAFHMGASIALAAIVGLADYEIGFERSLLVFYLLPVALAAWFVGRWFAAFISLLSTAVWLAGDFAAGARYSSFWVPGWNGGIGLAFFLVVIWLLSSLRQVLTELEERVRLRTADLQAEMAERTRLQKEVLEISSREQRRIGHELHDGLCQHLTATALAGQVLAGKLGALPQAEEAAEAERIVELVEEAVVLSRGLARGLFPVELEGGGLMEALHDLADTTRERHGLDCRFEFTGQVLLNEPSAATHLYRIAQEAVANAVKHGRPTRIVIEFSWHGEAPTLTIRDDGIGLPSDLSNNEGLGIRIMAHRASLIGAHFNIGRDGAARGTLVTCVLQPGV